MVVLVHVELASFLKSLVTKLTAVGNLGVVPNPVLHQSLLRRTRSATDVTGKYCHLASRMHQLVHVSVVPCQVIAFVEDLSTVQTPPGSFCVEIGTNVSHIERTARFHNSLMPPLDVLVQILFLLELLWADGAFMFIFRVSLQLGVIL